MLKSRSVLVKFAFATVMLSLTSNVWSFDIGDVSKAVTNGSVKLNFRYRYEFVDQENIDDQAGASTLRSRFTFASSPIDNFSFGVEADYASVIGGERYNSTENGNTRYPVVADPEGFDLNQAYLKYTTKTAELTGGRQKILHAAQRFVGGVSWRQNEQTYDAVRIVLKPNDLFSVDYGYVWNVNRIFGPDDGAQPADWESSSHLLDTKLKLNDRHTLSAFAYLLDFENDNGLPNSTSTYGLRYAGKFGRFGINATIARQSDYEDSPLDYDADYYSIAGSLKLDPITITAGYEVLGSDDGVAAFRTPLATLHKFQGWADKFLVTPATGIEDAYLGFSGAIGPVKLAATWHDFSADQGDADYGTEVNLVANYAVHEKVSLQLKFAEYSADDFSVDTTKIWFMVNVNL